MDVEPYHPGQVTAKGPHRRRFFRIRPDRHRLPLYRFYVYGLLEAVQFDQFVWMLYLLGHGFSLAQVSLVYVVYQATMFTTEVPSGYLADRLGRRTFLVAGMAYKATAALLLLYPVNLGVVLASAALTGLARTLPSGTNLAYFREVAEKVAGAAAEAAQNRDPAESPSPPGRTGPDGHPREVAAFDRLLATYVTLTATGTLLAGWVGGLVAGRSFQWLYALEAAVAATGMIVAAGLPRTGGGSGPVLHGAGGAGVRRGDLLASLASRWSLARSTWTVASRHWQTLALVVVVALTWAGSAAATEYTQPLLLALGASPGAVSTLLAGASLVTMAGARLAGAWRGPRRAVFVLIPWLLAAGALLRALAAVPSVGAHRVVTGPAEPDGGLALLNPALALAVGGLVLHRLAGGASQVTFNARLLEAAPAHLRGTVLSAANTLWAALSLTSFPVLGYAGERWGLGVLFGILAVVHAVTALAAVRVRTRSDRGVSS